ncbi:NTP transferase domain-containing protein [Serinicoccus sediminis]|uniref:NTP transferase domain-containing protein n=1 Tax=Serinicoccus sediminis TaxID=2306021 RepID=UPI00101F7F06|nr:NTP transferase domain-containing protein [Serinicoccus sediminis]
MTPTPRTPRPATTWRLVVPVQRAERAKTRLVAPEGVDRVDLARAIAADTLDAVCRALPPADVVVVTSDPVGAELAAGLGARVVGDPGGGLNAAIGAGLEVAAQGGADRAPRVDRAGRAPARPAEVAATPDGAWGVGVLLGDLPCLRPEDLLAALDICARHERAVVPDAEGTGTVLLTARDAAPAPLFGRGSAARHARTAEVLGLDLPRLRRDVDTTADLRDAIRLGTGARTARLLTPPDAEGSSA